LIVFHPIVFQNKELYDKCLEWIVELSVNSNYYINIGARVVLRAYLGFKLNNVIEEEKVERDGSHFHNLTLD